MFAESSSLTWFYAVTFRLGLARRQKRAHVAFLFSSGKFYYDKNINSLTILATFIGNPHFGKQYAVNLNTAHKELQELIKRVSVELELINVARKLER